LSRKKSGRERLTTRISGIEKWCYVHLDLPSDRLRRIENFVAFREFSWRSGRGLRVLIVLHLNYLPPSVLDARTQSRILVPLDGRVGKVVIGPG